MWAGAENAVMVGAAHDIYVTIPRGRAAELKAAAVDLSRGIKAPVTAGQTLGNDIGHAGRRGSAARAADRAG